MMVQPVKKLGKMGPNTVMVQRRMGMNIKEMAFQETEEMASLKGIFQSTLKCLLLNSYQ